MKSIENPRAREIFAERRAIDYAEIDRSFAILLSCEWILGIVLAVAFSPKAMSSHLFFAVFLGGANALFPIYLVRRRAGETINRYAIAVAQILFSTLFIHLTNGRIETHFHLFGSLAFLSFYLDSRLLWLATAITFADHLLRGFLVPQSVYGVLSASPWRAIEHGAWVVFEDVVLLLSIRRNLKSTQSIAEKQAELELSLSYVEDQVEHRTRELSDSQGRLEEAETVAAIGSFETDIRTERLYWSRSFYALCGIDSSVRPSFEVFASLVHPHDRPKLIEAKQMTRETADPFSIVLRIIRPDKAMRHFSITGEGRKDAEGRVIRLVGTAQDITEQVETDKMIEAQRSQILFSSRMSAVGEMAGGIAHEINNPLAIISGKSEQLRDLALQGEVPRDEVVQSAEKLMATASRIARIISSLRSLSRDGNKDPFERVNVKKLVEETLEFSGARFKNHEIAIHFECPDSALELEARPVQISQVILNFLNNAHDAVEKLGERWVKIQVEDAGTEVQISICDSGAGISKTVGERIFEPFFTTKAANKGTGLGLSVSKSIIDAHRGTVRIDYSSANTRFVIRLPKATQTLKLAA